MPRHKKVTEAILRERLADAGLLPAKGQDEEGAEEEDLASLSERLETVRKMVAQAAQKPKTHMNFFVMYDIQDDKMRKKVADFLQEKGCYRVQKSIFLAELPRDTFKAIYNALAELKEEYGNDDSLFLVPLAEDDLNSMKVIGPDVDMDMALMRQNTMIF